MLAASALAVVLGLGGAVVTFAAGKSMLRTELLNALGSTKSLGGAAALIDGAVSAAYHTLQSRAILAVVVSLIVLGLALAARGARTGVRIGLTVALVIAAAVFTINVNDGGVPGLIRALDGAAIIMALGAIVFAWLPPTMRFASDSKAMRRS
jgi:hypothetical protein